jgi:hypothetical protein
MVYQSIISLGICFSLTAQVQQDATVIKNGYWLDVNVSPSIFSNNVDGGSIAMNLLHKSRYYKLELAGTEKNYWTLSAMTGKIIPLAPNLTGIISGGLGLSKSYPIYANSFTPIDFSNSFTPTYRPIIPLEAKVVFGKHAGVHVALFGHIGKTMEAGLRTGISFGQFPTQQIPENSFSNLKNRTTAVKLGFSLNHYSLVGLNIEHAFNSKNSATLDLGFVPYEEGISAFRVNLDYRHYAIKNAGQMALSGIYLSPGIGFGAMTQTFIENIIALNGVLGYQRVWKSGFLFDVNAGFSAERSSMNYYDLLPKVDLKIGYAF